tara:strand:+ start:5616 stop:7619 length:2004 start_codon:yes stop_codon:yes gene_type:complete
MTNVIQTKKNLFINIDYSNIEKIISISNTNNFFHLGIALDISGSMGTYSYLIDDEGNKQETDLNYLDLIKHCIKLILEILIEHENYILSLFVFNDKSYPIIISKFINKENKDEIFDKIARLKPSGCTNIWSAIFNLNEIFKDKIDNLPKKIILFTDGISNINPPRGIKNELSRLIEQYNMKIPVHVLGFGYNLDIQSLLDISNITNGSFNFIPTTSEMLTTMVHLASRIILEKFKKCEIIVKYSDIEEKDIPYVIKYLNENNIIVDKSKLVDYHNIISGDIEIKIDVGPLCGNKNFVLNSTKSNIPNVYLNIITNINTTQEEQVCNKLNILYNTNNKITECILIRNEFIRFLEEMNKNALRDKFDKNKEIYKRCIELFDTNIEHVYEYESDLIGEIKLALLNEENYNKWGKYYIPSLIGAYSSQVCNSFRDPGIQTFLNNEFKELRDKLNILCDNLPPPEPSSVKTIYNTNTTQVNRQQVSMRQYEEGGCFGENSLIKIDENKYKLIKYLKKGDKVVNDKGGFSKVLCILKIKCNKQQEMCVFNNNFTITPYHPIFINNEWKFPKDIIRSSLINCDYLYNIVLDDRKSIIINNTICCTLGHEIKGKVIEHQFFGSYKLITDLMISFSKEFHEGCITSIKGFTRDKKNLVNGFTRESHIDKIKHNSRL